MQYYTVKKDDYFTGYVGITPTRLILWTVYREKGIGEKEVQAALVKAAQQVCD